MRATITRKWSDGRLYISMDDLLIILYKCEAQNFSASDIRHNLEEMKEDAEGQL